jgi:cell division septum initiation protein DivIVA
MEPPRPEPVGRDWVVPRVIASPERNGERRWGKGRDHVDQKAEQLRAVENLLGNNGVSPGMVEQDVWEWLQRVACEFETLRARNAKLTAQVQEFERLTRGATALSDDELVAELPSRMVRALRASQEVAEEIVRRARSRGTLMLRKAENKAAEIRAKAEDDAATVRHAAADDAEAVVGAARAQAEEMVAEARISRHRILSDLEAQRSDLTAELRSLRAVRTRLIDVLSSVQASLHNSAPPGEEEGGHSAYAASDSPEVRQVWGRANRRSGPSKTSLLDWRRHPSDDVSRSLPVSRAADQRGGSRQTLPG